MLTQIKATKTKDSKRRIVLPDKALEAIQYGTILLSMGTDIKIVSELLGHSDVSFTYNVYIGIFDRDKHDAVMKLNQI